MTDGHRCPPTMPEESSALVGQEADHADDAAQPEAVRGAETTPPGEASDASKGDKTSLWKTLLVGIVGALIGAAATLGGQWLTANWTDVRSQNEFVHSTKLDLYRRIAAAFSDANSQTWYFTEVLLVGRGTAPDKNVPLDRYDVDGYKLLCANMSGETQHALRLVAADAVITATPAVIKITQDAALQYELAFNSCHWITQDGNRAAIPPMKSFANFLQNDYNTFITTARDEFGFDKLCTPSSERMSLIRYLRLDC